MLLQLVVIDGQIRCVDLWSHGRSSAQLGKYYYNGPIFYLFQEIQIPLMTISKGQFFICFKKFKFLWWQFQRIICKNKQKEKKKDSLLKVNG